MKTPRVELDERKKLLHTSPIFGPAEESVRDGLARIATVRVFDAAENLFSQDEPAQGFYLVAAGSVKVFRLGADGREQVLHILETGEMVGEVPTFQGSHYPAFAMALVATRALYIPRDQFLALGRREPELLLGVLAVLARRLRGFVTLIDDLSLKEVSARLAKHLLDLSVRQSAWGVELEGTKTMLAARLGTVSETLSRTLKKMQDRGIVEVQGRIIVIRDADRLTALCAGEKL